jgi:hypothetical protein
MNKASRLTLHKSLFGAVVGKMHNTTNDPFPELENVMDKKLMDELMENIDEGRFQAHEAVRKEMDKRLATDTELLDFVLPVFFGDNGKVTLDQTRRLAAIETTYAALRLMSKALMFPVVAEPRHVLSAARTAYNAAMLKIAASGDAE